VNIWDTWKTLKYLNINDSFHLKDFEISKYKRESKGRWPIKICRFIFVSQFWTYIMPDLKYLYRVLYIAFLNKLLIYFLTKLTIKSHIY
jgi:hypothetical protein